MNNGRPLLTPTPTYQNRLLVRYKLNHVLTNKYLRKRRIQSTRTTNNIPVMIGGSLQIVGESEHPLLAPTRERAARRKGLRVVYGQQNGGSVSYPS
eukprot:sb/3479125/